MSTVVTSAFRLGMPWQTFDPFLFCVHHDDAFPKANGAFGPAAPLTGRNIGQDFANKDGWNMYHGETVPGFPQHPHRGFETVTVVRRGLIDHSDSLGAAARYGQGDTQWLTAGAGVVHSEMFPLLDTEAPNPAELFQIWLNLPPKDKMAEPHFTMFWAKDIPTVDQVDDAGRAVSVTMVAGAFGGRDTPKPPPSSWAANPDNDVAIWTIRLAPGARFTLPATRPGVDRALYFFTGTTLRIDGKELPVKAGVRLAQGVAVPLENGPVAAELLLLQGRPIGAPVANHGPFVMNTQAELAQAFADYRRTRFGGWPWPKDDPVHGAEPGRFAKRPGGVIERP